MSSLAPIKTLLHDYGLLAKKAFGQHFLLHAPLLEKIARSADITEEDIILEIGPGPGGLTRALMQSPARHIILVEKDERFIPILKMMQAHAGGEKRLSFIIGDAMDATIYQKMPQKPNKMVANLPYNVATPIMIDVLKNIDFIEKMVVLVQKEVAERVIANPHKNKADRKHFGRLACICQLLADNRILFDVGPGNFVPPPKVMSSVLCMDRKPQKQLPSNITVHRIQQFEKITQLLFSNRRKTIYKILTSAPALFLDKNAITSQLEMLGIDPKTRPEMLLLSQIYALSNMI